MQKRMSNYKPLMRGQAKAHRDIFPGIKSLLYLYKNRIKIVVTQDAICYNVICIFAYMRFEDYGALRRR